MMNIELSDSYPVSKRPRRSLSRVSPGLSSDASRSNDIIDILSSIFNGEKQFRSKSSTTKENLNFINSLKIYAYLSVRLRYNPAFLNRNLSYIKTKKNQKKRRKKLDLESMLNQMKVKNFEELESKSLSLQLDLIRIDLMDSNKIEEIEIRIFGMNHQSRKLPHLILNEINNSNILFTKKIYNVTDTILMNDFFLIPQSVTSLYFYVNIGQNFREYFQNFDLKEFINLKNFSLNFNLKLTESSEEIKFQKSSSSLDELINKFRLNQNFIKFKLYNETKTSKVKLKTNSKKITTSQISIKNFTSLIYHLSLSDSIKDILSFSSNFNCPFCFLLMNSFVSLISHLKSIHFRYICQEFRVANTQQIKIIPDDMFDGSYSISDSFNYKKNEYMGYGKSREKPIKRKPGLLLWVYNNFYGKMIRKNNEIDLMMTLHSQNLTSNSVQDRIYYHSMTNLAKNFDSDDDSEGEQEWINEIRQRNFDKFEYANQGEKEIMNLWNDHCSKHNLISFSNVFNICQLFLKENMSVLKKLEKNVLLHFVNLLDNKLLKKKELFKLIELTNELSRTTG